MNTGPVTTPETTMLAKKPAEKIQVPHFRTLAFTSSPHYLRR